MKLLSIKKTLFFLAAVLSFFFLLLLLLPYVEKKIVEKIGNQAGLDLLVEDIGGNVFTHLTFARIQGARRDSSQPLSDFDVRNLRISYSLPQLVDGVESFLSTMQIEASQVHAVVDMTSDAKPETSPSDPENSEIIMLPDVLPGIRVDDFDLEIHSPDSVVALADSFFFIAPPAGPSGQVVTVEIPVLQIESGGQEQVKTSCNLKLHYAEDGLRIESMTMPDRIDSLQGSLDWNRDDQSMVWDLRAELSGGELQSAGSLRGGLINLQLELATIDIAALSTLLLYDEFPLAGIVSGSASLHIDPAHGDSFTADVDLALAEGDLLGKKTDFLLQGGFKDDIFSVRKLAGNFGVNEVTIEEAALPLSLFTAWDISRLGDVKMKSVRLHLPDIPALLASFGQDVPLASVPDHTLDLEGSLAEGKVQIVRGDFASQKNSLLLTGAELHMPPSGQSFLDSPFAGVLDFRLDDLRELSALFSLPLMEGKGRGEAVVSGTFRKPTGTVTLVGENFTYDRCKLGDFAIRAQADSSAIKVLSLALRNSGDILHASGSYLLDSEKIGDVKGKIVVSDVGRYTGSCLEMEGEFEGDLQAVFSTTGAGELQADLEMEHAVFAGFGVAGLRGKVTTDWSRYRIDGGDVATEFGTLRFSSLIVPELSLERVRVEMTAMTYSSNSADFSLDKSAALVLSYGKGVDLEVGEARFGSDVGNIVMKGSLSLEGESSFQIQATDMTSSGWLEKFTGEEYQFSGADMLITLHGPLSLPKASLVGRVAGISCPQLTEPFSGDMDLEYEGGTGITAHKFLLATSQGQHVSLSGRIPFDPLAKNQFLPRPISLTGSAALPGLKGLILENPVDGMMEGEFSGEFRLMGSWENPAGEMNFKGSNLFLHHFLKDAPKEPLTVDCQLRYDAQEILLDNFIVQAKPFSVKTKGKWTGIPTLAALIRRPPDGLPGSLSFLARLDMPDVGWLSPYAGGVRRLSGRLETSLQVDGPAAEPKVTGKMKLEQGGVRLESATLPPLDRLTMTASLDGGVVHLEKMTGRFGGAPVELSGDVVLTGADAPVFDWKLTGKSLLLYRDEGMKIRADADLNLQGPLARLRLGGKIMLTDSRYGKNVDFLSMFRGSAKVKADTGMQFFSFSEPPLRDLVFDVGVVTAEKPFLIANNMARGAARPALRLIGTGEIPVLVGRIYVEPTNINVPAGRIAVESGIITFPENDPDRPTFDLSATSRLAGYDIAMHLQGNSEEPVITLSSDPPLPEDELLLLVLTGSPPQSALDGGKSRIANMKMAVYLGKGLLSRWFGGGGVEDDESVLERFDLEFGRQISKTGQETVEAQFRLIEGLLLPGDRLYITSEKDVYDNVNVGVKIVFRFQ
ncbi:MAG: translocation/assembly module TamB domain-containing protein [Pseudomonadota bacterium]